MNGTLEMKGTDMKYALMLAVAGTVMTGCGAEDMETRDEATSESRAAAQGLNSGKNYCITRLEVGERGNAFSAESAPPAAHCFDTFAEAISYATKGAVRVGPHATMDNLKPEEMMAAGVLAAEYDFTYFNGEIFTLDSSATCAQAGERWFASLPTSVDNRVSSVRLFDTSCITFKHFSEPNLAGNWIDCGTGYSCATMSFMDNQTSSILLRPY